MLYRLTFPLPVIDLEREEEIMSQGREIRTEAMKRKDRELTASLKYLSEFTRRREASFYP